MAEISALDEVHSSNKIISLSDGSSSNALLLYYSIGTNKINIFDGTNIGSFTAPNIKTFNKVAVRYNSNSTTLWVNGVEVVSIAPKVFSGFNVLNFTNENDILPFYGNTKQIQYYNSALTDSDLEQLTSWVSFQEMAEGQLYTIE